MPFRIVLIHVLIFIWANGRARIMDCSQFLLYWISLFLYLMMMTCIFRWLIIIQFPRYLSIRICFSLPIFLIILGIIWIRMVWIGLIISITGILFWYFSRSYAFSCHILICICWCNCVMTSWSGICILSASNIIFTGTHLIIIIIWIIVQLLIGIISPISFLICIIFIRKVLSFSSTSYFACVL